MRKFLGALWCLLAVACSGDDDAAVCMPEPGCYTSRLGVGTGSCDAEMLLASLGPLPGLSVDATDMCESVSVGSVPVQGACSGSAQVSAVLTASGPNNGQLTIDGQCGGNECEHSFVINFASDPSCAAAIP